jgi:ABC-type Fe3+-hydroxamate transport system substrate-binding protein
MLTGDSEDGMGSGPQRIVCLTEEPTEVLYALGEQHRIVGISGFTVRPSRARKEKPRSRHSPARRSTASSRSNPTWRSDFPTSRPTSRAS